MLKPAEAWGFANALPDAAEVERRCKTSRLYYAAFHHARAVSTVVTPERRHRDFWLALATGDAQHKLLSRNGRMLLTLRTKADYRIDEDFTALDMENVRDLARAIAENIEAVQYSNGA